MPSSVLRPFYALLTSTLQGPENGLRTGVPYRSVTVPDRSAFRGLRVSLFYQLY